MRTSARFAALAIVVIGGWFTIGAVDSRAGASVDPRAGGGVAPQPAAYPYLKAQAEKLVAEGSYQQAHDVYAQAENLDLPAVEKRWVQFRLADTSWRSAAATNASDTTAFDQAQRVLQQLIDAITRPEDRDLVWAEAQESLGDLQWTGRRLWNWSAALIPSSGS